MYPAESLPGMPHQPSISQDSVRDRAYTLHPSSSSSSSSTLDKPPPYTRSSPSPVYMEPSSSSFASVVRPLPTPPARRSGSLSPPLYSSRQLSAPARPASILLSSRPPSFLSSSSRPSTLPSSASAQWIIHHWPKDRTFHCMMPLGEEYILFGTSKGLLVSRMPLRTEDKEEEEGGEGLSAPRTLSPIPTTAMHSMHPSPSSPILLVMGGQVRMYTTSTLLQLCRFQDTWPSFLDHSNEGGITSARAKRTSLSPSFKSPTLAPPSDEVEKESGAATTATSLLRGLGGSIYREGERLTPLLPPSLGRRLRGQSYKDADHERARLFNSLLNSYQVIGRLYHVQTLDTIRLAPVCSHQGGREEEEEEEEEKVKRWEWIVCVGAKKSTNLYMGSFLSGFTLQCELWNPESPKHLHLIRKKTCTDSSRMRQEKKKEEEEEEEERAEGEEGTKEKVKETKIQKFISHILVQYTRELVLVEVPEMKVTTVDQLPGPINALTSLSLPRLFEEKVGLNEEGIPDFDPAILISCDYGWSLLRSISNPNPPLSGEDRLLSPGIVQCHAGQWTAFDQWSSSVIGPEILHILPLPSAPQPHSIVCIGPAGIQIRGRMGEVLVDHSLPSHEVPVMSCAWPRSSTLGPNRLLILSLSPTMPLPVASLTMYLDTPSE
ncbi:MAG: hypothetical protein DHS80DRAFT_25009 [Piptocephalis tieghemiana]|nr:MAG: hypothetical protein DHS80DRAFT_25009 [Piptocephalis tieghemiana]